MTVLIVGAGAAGGYLGELLIAGGREVTFLVHSRMQSRLSSDGLRLRHGDEIRTTAVNAVTSAELASIYDVVVVAVRAGSVGSAIDDFRPAVGYETAIVPIMNGMAHLSLLTAAFGRQRALGAATRLVASMSADGIIEIVQAGVDMQIGLARRG